MNKALFAGSFAPFTNGHLDILRQAVVSFDEVIVAIGNNPDKDKFIPLDDNLRLIKESVKQFDNAKVLSYEGLTVNLARKSGAYSLIRGIRNFKDFDYERELAMVNFDLAPDINTVFFITKPEYCHISSSTVRELISIGADISKYVPVPVNNYFIAH